MSLMFLKIIETLSLMCLKMPIFRCCPKLVKIGKPIFYPLIERVLRLVLTLPVSTATTERAFSAMKIIKT
jgi:hypothetical protein